MTSRSPSPAGAPSSPAIGAHSSREARTGQLHSPTCSLPAPLRGERHRGAPQERGRPRRIGQLTVTPVASLDWRGSESDQVAWVVEGVGARIIHCGDTMWHGDWWGIARERGPFGLAFLPVNGTIATFEGYEADVPVTLTPEQTVEAGAILGATAVCASHYELFDDPPTYVEQRDIAGRFVRAAARRGLTAHLPGVGEVVPLVTRRGGKAAWPKPPSAFGPSYRGGEGRRRAQAQRTPVSSSERAQTRWASSVLRRRL
ncbi:MBL fold metallo-hydrolase [Streptomyces sp. AC558_RSS880]|uniref:MBL fold metallo-hydrolase n=1 Tax=Streptomyces sp. AC558_RSS880 TaxID=2823687 RepID=UPI0027E56185|nr:MBL fold metallo-hydrolase [Streptomyces sp. AC558_RSS880]